MPESCATSSKTKTTIKPKSITFDFETSNIKVDFGSKVENFPSQSAEGFAYMSDAWLRAGWDTKYVYSFTWMGRPIIQLPEDIVRIQELFYLVKPDVLIETGIAHGGSAILYASLCKAMGKGKVVAVDIEIRKHNRTAIESHELFPFITLIEGDSTAKNTLSQVKEQIPEGSTVMLVLDSCHTKEHVLKELSAYAPLVSKHSYIVVMDGIMGQLDGAPRTEEDWRWNNPTEAAAEFVKNNSGYELIEPPFAFNEGSTATRVTYSPGGIIRKL